MQFESNNIYPSIHLQFFEQSGIFLCFSTLLIILLKAAMIIGDSGLSKCFPSSEYLHTLGMGGMGLTVVMNLHGVCQSMSRCDSGRQLSAQQMLHAFNEQAHAHSVLGGETIE